MLHIVIPMAGEGSRFAKAGYSLPKPLIELNGKPFFWWAVASIAGYVSDFDLTFVALEDHVRRFGIDREIRKHFGKCDIVTLPRVLAGPVYSCLEGISNIRDSEPVIFNDCDHWFKCADLNRYISGSDADGMLFYFESSNPQYSYLIYGQDGRLKGTVEKQVASDRAICEAYYFRNRETYIDCFRRYKDTNRYSELFMSGMYDHLLAGGKKVLDVRLDRHMDFGTPERYREAQETMRDLSVNDIAGMENFAGREDSAC